MYRLAFAFLLSWLLAFGASLAAEPDLSTPEATLAGYIESLRRGDIDGVLARYHGIEKFYLPGPMRIDEYKIVKKLVYGKREVDDWNNKGIVPPAKVGDVELQVLKRIDGREQMFSYHLRKLEDGWRLIANYGWGMD